MTEAILNFDEQLFLYLNGMHNSMLDSLMWLASDKLIWIPLYLFFLWIIYRQERKNFWLVLLVIICMVVVSDQSANLFKNNVMRLRPTNDPSIRDLVLTVNGYTGGQYGFYSGHASNSFVVAVFVVGLIRHGRKYLVPLCFGYALMVSYSRIYLGVHYPGDVLAGAIAGSLIALLFVRIYHNLDSRLAHNSGKS
jgi:undecaprenyl-diphosphatase